MRTDVKIGIAVGLVVAIVVVVWFAMRGNNQDQPASPGPTVVERPTPTNVPSTPRPRPIVISPPASPTTRPAPVPIVIAPTTRPATPVIADPPPVARPPVAPVIVPPVPVPAAAPDVYTVKEGDSGFWGIAQKHYGNGKYWTLIAQANPTADSNRLRPGQVLKMPPKPSEAATTAGRTGSTGVRDAATPAVGTGEKLHVVKEGDNMWNLAQTYYGDGTLWPMIAQRNSGVNANALRPGANLVIPPKPDRTGSTTTSRTGTAVSSTATRTTSGTRTGSSTTRPAPARTTESGGYTPPSIDLSGL